MVPHSLNLATFAGSQVVWEDGERVFRRGWRLDDEGKQHAVLARCSCRRPPVAFKPRSADARIRTEGRTGGTWAVRPLELVSDAGRTMLVFEDPGGEPIERLLGGPVEIGRFLRLAIRLPPRWASSTSAGLSTRTSSQRTSWSTTRPERCG